MFDLNSLQPGSPILARISYFVLSTLYCYTQHLKQNDVLQAPHRHDCYVWIDVVFTIHG